MKRTICTKLLVALLAVMMLVSALSVAAMAADTSYVLEATALTEGTGKTGTETVGDYFTIYWGDKGKVSANNKEWSDGYTSSQRLDFGGKTKFDEFANKGVSRAIGFTTSGAATVKVWWVSGSSDGRYLSIADASFAIKASTPADVKEGEICVSELTLDAAGTYYLGCSENTSYIFKVEVTESASSGGNTTPPAGDVTPPAPTGDTSAIFAMMAMMVVSLAAVFVLSKKQAR